MQRNRYPGEVGGGGGSKKLLSKSAIKFSNN